MVCWIWVAILYGLSEMTNDEWLNIRPQESYSTEPYKAKTEIADYNIVIEYPQKIITSEQIKEFFKRGLF